MPNIRVARPYLFRHSGAGRNPAWACSMGAIVGIIVVCPRLFYTLDGTAIEAGYTF
jgi:uncharacterized protein YqgC (DUF456 family)